MGFCETSNVRRMRWDGGRLVEGGGFTHAFHSQLAFNLPPLLSTVCFTLPSLCSYNLTKSLVLCLSSFFSSTNSSILTFYSIFFSVTFSILLLTFSSFILFGPNVVFLVSSFSALFPFTFIFLSLHYSFLIRPLPQHVASPASIAMPRPFTPYPPLWPCLVCV